MPFAPCRSRHPLPLFCHAPPPSHSLLSPRPLPLSLSHGVSSVMCAALGLFYQPALVHAAEASLSQILNLGLAYVLLTTCRVGRISAVGSMRAKLLSFVLVTAGLVACTFEEGSPPAAATAAGTFTNALALAPASAVSTVVGASAAAVAATAGTALALGNISAGTLHLPASAEFYSHYPQFPPLMHSLRGGNAFGRPWRSRHRRARKARREFFFFGHGD